MKITKAEIGDSVFLFNLALRLPNSNIKTGISTESQTGRINTGVSSYLGQVNDYDVSGSFSNGGIHFNDGSVELPYLNYLGSYDAINNNPKYKTTPSKRNIVMLLGTDIFFNA